MCHRFIFYCKLNFHTSVHKFPFINLGSRLISIYHHVIDKKSHTFFQKNIKYIKLHGGCVVPYLHFIYENF